MVNGGYWTQLRRYETPVGIDGSLSHMLRGVPLSFFWSQSFPLGFHISLLISFLSPTKRGEALPFCIFACFCPAWKPTLPWSQSCHEEIDASVSFHTFILPSNHQLVKIDAPLPFTCFLLLAGEEDVESKVRCKMLKQWLSWMGSGDTFCGTWSAVVLSPSTLSRRWLQWFWFLKSAYFGEGLAFGHPD